MTEANGVSMEPKIIDLISATEDSSFNNKTILKEFIQPGITTRPKIREIYQPDGSTVRRVLPEKLRHIPDFILFDTFGHEVHHVLRQQEDEYYLSACEKQILQTKSAELAAYIPDNSSIFDLGCGSMEKTKVLIDHLRRSGKKGIKVHGVDIDRPHLKNTMTTLLKEQQQKHQSGEDVFEFIGVHSTFEQSIPFIKKTPGPCILLFLGGTIGNMYRDEAKRFCAQFQEKAMKPGDCFFIGFDKRKEPAVIARAYQDSKGALRTFCTHGLEILDSMFGTGTRLSKNVSVLAGYNDIEGLNEIFYKSLVDQTIPVPPPYSGSDTETVKVELKKGELIDLIRSYKYSQDEIQDLAKAANLVVTDQWSDPKDMFWITMFKVSIEDEQ
eukprot:g2088.t1